MKDGLDLFNIERANYRGIKEELKVVLMLPEMKRSISNRACSLSPFFTFSPAGRQEQDVAEAKVFVPCWPAAQRVRSRVPCIPCTASGATDTLWYHWTGQELFSHLPAWASKFHLALQVSSIFFNKPLVLRPGYGLTALKRKRISSTKSPLLSIHLSHDPSQSGKDCSPSHPYTGKSVST